LYEVARAENPPLRDRLEAMLRLENITRLVRRFRPREVQVPAENVELAADFTEQMRDVAEARNMRFLVVIIPTLHDLRADRHGESIERYVSSLESRNVAILDLLGVVGLGDYYLEEGHFNPTGAKTVARATLERLQ
jgi:lysophospholipase L1-like esterase